MKYVIFIKTLATTGDFKVNFPEYGDNFRYNTKLSLEVTMKNYDKPTIKINNEQNLSFDHMNSVEPNETSNYEMKAIIFIARNRSWTSLNLNYQKAIRQL